MSKLDLNLMVVLEAIYDRGNTSRAAESLYLSQSAVSHALARLRSIYNDPLFVRQGHSMLPTPTTERIIISVKRGLTQLRGSVDLAQNFDSLSHEQVFKISQRDALEFALCGPLMKQFEQCAPLCGLHSINSSPRLIAEQLHQGEADLCIELLQPLPEHIYHRKLFSEELVVVGRQDHPYFDKRASEKRMLKYPQVLITPLADEMEWVDHALAGRGQRRQVAIRCKSYGSALNVLLHSDKLAIMPKAYVAQQLEFFPIRYSTIPFPVANVEIHMYWHQRHHNDPANQWFRQTVIDTLSSVEELSSVMNREGL